MDSSAPTLTAAHVKIFLFIGKILLTPNGTMKVTFQVGYTEIDARQIPVPVACLLFVF